MHTLVSYTCIHSHIYTTLYIHNIRIRNIIMPLKFIIRIKKRAHVARYLKILYSNCWQSTGYKMICSLSRILTRSYTKSFLHACGSSFTNYSNWISMCAFHQWDLLEFRLSLRHHSNGVHLVTEDLGRGGELSDDSKPEVVHAAREEDFWPVLLPILWLDKREVSGRE